MKFTPLCVCICLAASFVLPFAPARADTAHNEIYAGIGTTGGTLGYGYAFSKHRVVRIEGNFLSYSHAINVDSSRYEGDLKFRTFGLYYDFFLLGPFRVTGGALVGSNKFEGSETVNHGTVTINGQRYDANGQYVRSTIDFNSISPYLGIGWGHHPGFGLGFFSDVGFIYGRPTASIAVSSGLRQAAGDQNIAAEQASLQSQADHLRFFPVVRVGIDFHW